MSQQIWSIVLAATLGAIALVNSVLLLGVYVLAWSTPWFEQRLVPTIAIAHGQPIYQMPVTGPLFSCIYGPLSYLAFLPVAFLPTVRSMLVAGSITSTVFLLLPLVFTGYYFVSNHNLALTDVAILLLFSFVAVTCLPPLSYVAAWVTADSPSICLMALSALLLYTKRDQPRWTTAALSSLTLVLSVGCKQNMVIAAMVILFTVFYFFTRRFARLYAVFLVIVTIITAGIVTAVHHDWQAIYYNDVVVPKNWPVFKWLIPVGAFILSENSVLLVLTLTCTVLIGFVTQQGAPWPNESKLFGLIFFAIAAAFLPSSIAAYAAKGGEVNSFAHAIYFLLLGTLITAFEVMDSIGSMPRSLLSLRLWFVVVTLALLGSAFRTRLTKSVVELTRQVPTAIQAYNYCKLKPGQVYFPSNSIGVYLAERKFYHTDWGVMNLSLARQPLQRAEILRYIPQQAQYVALPRIYDMVSTNAFLLTFVAPHRIAAEIAGLNDFVVFLIER